MSEVAVRGGGISKLQTKSEALGFFFFEPFHKLFPVFIIGTENVVCGGGGGFGGNH